MASRGGLMWITCWNHKYEWDELQKREPGSVDPCEQLLVSLLILCLYQFPELMMQNKKLRDVHMSMHTYVCKFVFIQWLINLPTLFDHNFNWKGSGWWGSCGGGTVGLTWREQVKLFPSGGASQKHCPGISCFKKEIDLEVISCDDVSISVISRNLME